jgi:hypothetical protein
MVLVTVVFTGTLTATAYASNTSNLNNTGTVTIPSAESVYQSETMELPPSTGSFIILIVNEAHESWQDEKHKLITDKNSYYIPKNLHIPQGTSLSFLNADAPWDTPHPQTIELVDEGGEVVYTTGVLDYTNSSQPTVLPVGNYTVVNTEYEATEGTISITNQRSNGNLVVGGFYAPSHQVENNMDNDGGCTLDLCNIIGLNSQRMDFKSLANIILLMQLVTTVLENTGQITRRVTTH